MVVTESVEGVTDPEGDPVTITSTGITQDESVNGRGDGQSCPDALGVGTGTASLRAERGALGDGRVYHISFRADDAHGNQCEGTVTVCVPLRRDDTCIDGGELFDATNPTCDGMCGDSCHIGQGLESAFCANEALPANVTRLIGSARRALAQSARTASVTR